MISEDSEALRHVANTFLDGTTFNPLPPLEHPQELGMSPSESQTANLPLDILHFPQLLNKWGIKEYKRGDLVKSMDLFLSAIKALSECDETLQLWSSNHDVRMAKWKALSYNTFRDVVQIRLAQKSEGNVKTWIPFERMIELSFDDDIKIPSRVRFFRLCAMSLKAEEDMAIVLLLTARCFDPNDQLVIDMLHKRHPTPLGFVLAYDHFEKFRKKHSVKGEVLQKMKRVNVQDLGAAADQKCSICQYEINSLNETGGQIRKAAVSSCDHSFHELCVRSYVSYNTFCPECRRDWSLESGLTT